MHEIPALKMSTGAIKKLQAYACFVVLTGGGALDLSLGRVVPPGP